MTKIEFIIDGNVIDQIEIDTFKKLSTKEKDFLLLTPDQQAILLEDEIEELKARIGDRVEIRSSSI